jgi:hypothetical protein
LSTAFLSLSSPIKPACDCHVWSYAYLAQDAPLKRGETYRRTVPTPSDGSVEDEPKD